MRVVIIGQSWLAGQVLRSITALDGVRVVAVCPEKPQDTFEKSAEAMGVKTVRLQRVPICDLIIAAHCHSYLNESAREQAEMGVLAYHPSLLPRHRGRDAIWWTIKCGDPIAGGTVFWMDDGIDTGPIEAQDWCHVAAADTPMSLWKRDLGPMGVRLLTGTVERLAGGEKPARMTQDDRFATYEPPARWNL